MISIGRYEIFIRKDLENWKRKMRRRPSLINRASKGVQNKLNNILPEKYHEALTFAIKNMVKLVLTGSQYMTNKTYPNMTLVEREKLIRKKIKSYKRVAMIEGAGTGAGGFLMGLADFSLLLGIKIKLLYEIASIYGFNIRDFRERLYILNIFQLAFSSQERINEVFEKMENWEEYSKLLPVSMNQFDWRTFQQEYRDYIDLAKLAQMLPGIGAVVGFYTNGKLIDKLGETAMNGYRMRILK